MVRYIITCFFTTELNESNVFSIQYEFGTVDRQGNPINIVPGQCVINIPLGCLYDGMPPTFVIPSPPLPDPISLDLFHVRWAVLNC